MRQMIVPESVLQAWGGHTPPEAPLIEWAAQFIRSDKVALDIGAHVGSWCITLADRASQWHAFEPSRKAFNSLCGSVSLNDLDDKIIPHRLALHDKNGDAIMRRISADGGGNHMTCIPHPADAVGFEIVDTARLDDLYEFEKANVGFIKMDVEGNELATLRGMESTLHESDYPPIIFECWNHEWFASQRRSLFLYLHSLGYRTVPIAGWPEMTLAEYER